MLPRQGLIFDDGGDICASVRSCGSLAALVRAAKKPPSFRSSNSACGEPYTSARKDVSKDDPAKAEDRTCGIHVSVLVAYNEHRY